MKGQIARSQILGLERDRAYQNFYRCLYSFADEAFNERWGALVGSVPEGFRVYLQTNWHDCRETWSYAYRTGARTYGNNTNKTIESFFHDSELA